MFDVVYSLEPNIFQVISQAFPFLKELYIRSGKPQKHKQYLSTSIIFPCLVLLNLALAHTDYAEQLLFDENTHLPRLLNLYMTYKSLTMITNNFTNDAARLTCSKLKYLKISEPFVRPENFDQYFPLL